MDRIFETKHYRNDNGLETEVTTDQFENIWHFKNSEGFEFWKEYDEQGRLTYHKDHEGKEFCYAYDKDKKQIKVEVKNEDGFQIFSLKGEEA